jgi:hypothetical protein
MAFTPKMDRRKSAAALHHLAPEMGGSALHTGGCGQIAEELRSLFSVAYHSTNIRMVVTMSDPINAVRARTGCYAR